MTTKEEPMQALSNGEAHCSIMFDDTNEHARIIDTKLNSKLLLDTFHKHPISFLAIEPSRKDEAWQLVTSSQIALCQDECLYKNNKTDGFITEANLYGKFFSLNRDGESWDILTKALLPVFMFTSKLEGEELAHMVVIDRLGTAHDICSATCNLEEICEAPALQHVNKCQARSINEVIRVAKSKYYRGMEYGIHEPAVTIKFTKCSDCPAAENEWLQYVKKRMIESQTWNKEKNSCGSNTFQKMPKMDSHSKKCNNSAETVTSKAESSTAASNDKRPVSEADAILQLKYQKSRSKDIQRILAA